MGKPNFLLCLLTALLHLTIELEVYEIRVRLCGGTFCSESVQGRIGLEYDLDTVFI